MEQIGYLVNLGVIPHLCNMLVVKESKVILVILDALGNILLVGFPYLMRTIKVLNFSSNFNKFSREKCKGDTLRKILIFTVMSRKV